jgi:hypothetical protein
VERKARWDLILYATLSAEMRSTKGSFRNGRSKALGLSSLDIHACTQDVRVRILAVVRRVLDEVFWLCKAGRPDAAGVRECIVEGFLPDLEDVQRDRKISEGLVRAFKQAKVVARWKHWGPTVSCARQILSIVAPLLPSRVVQALFDATHYEVKQAKLHAEENGAGGRAQGDPLTRMCRAEERIETFNTFIDMYTVTLDASTKNATQGLVRVLNAEIAELFRKYEKFCASKDPPEEAFCGGVFRDLSSRQKGFQDPRVETCVCSWCKDGREAFERLMKLLDMLPAPTDAIKDRVNLLKRRVTAFYRWLKDGVFANQCLRSDDEAGAPAVASHCSIWLQAVRDLFGNETPFWQECKHHGVHGDRCTKCDEFVLLQTDIHLAIDQLAVVAEREKLLAVAARCFGSDAGILRYIAHLVRDFHQGKYRDDVLRKMLMHQILVWCDYAMKWLPMKKLQTISDRMGLSGVSVHNFVVIMKLEGGKFMYLNFRVSCDDATQDFVHSLGGLLIVLLLIKSFYAHITGAFLGLDNAVNYSGIGFAAGLNLMLSLTGIKILAAVTNEPGMVSPPFVRTARLPSCTSRVSLTGLVLLPWVLIHLLW